MNVLILGTGKGSWKVRGLQLGKAIGARVSTAPSDDDLRWADIVVIVKRAIDDWAELVHGFGKPLVWDALDFWDQPEQNGLLEAEARALLAEKIARYRPALVIGATEAMAHAAGGVYLPHHSRIGLTPAPARDVVTTVGYEGTRKFLGRWGQAVQKECDRRGWTFVINPPDIRVCDILVAFRDGEHDGWMCDAWKSGVKAVNAIAAGRPLIAQGYAAVLEIQPVCWMVKDGQGIADAFDYWSSLEWRRIAVDKCRHKAAAFTLDAVAARYRQILQAVARKAA